MYIMWRHLELAWICRSSTHALTAHSAIDLLYIFTASSLSPNLLIPPFFRDRKVPTPFQAPPAIRAPLPPDWTIVGPLTA